MGVVWPGANDRDYPYIHLQQILSNHGHLIILHLKKFFVKCMDAEHPQRNEAGYGPASRYSIDVLWHR